MEKLIGNGTDFCRPLAAGVSDESIWKLYLQHREQNQRVLDLCHEALTLRSKREPDEQLQIVSAVYGNLHDLDDGHESKVEPFLDVTAAVQVLVHNDRLSIAGGRNKADLLGFYDPCPGYPARELRIKYHIAGQYDEIEVADMEAVLIDANSRAQSQ
jgi:DnaJ homolog subfamily C member 11